MDTAETSLGDLLLKQCATLGRPLPNGLEGYTLTLLPSTLADLIRASGKGKEFLTVRYIPNSDTYELSLNGLKLIDLLTERLRLSALESLTRKNDISPAPKQRS